MKKVAMLLVVVMMLFVTVAVSESASFENGDSGAGVRAIQKTLVALNYLSEEYVTSNYDDMTELAVLAFQIDHSIDPTGIADSDTQHAISDALRSMLGGNATNDNTNQDTPLAQDEKQSGNDNNAVSNEPIVENEDNGIATEPVDAMEEGVPNENSKPEIELIQEKIRIGERDKYSDHIPAVYIAVLRNNTDTPCIINDLSVDFEDAQGSLILTQSMLSIYPGVIMPGENGYICERINDYYEENFDPHTIANAILHYEVKSRPGFKYQDVTVTDVKTKDEGSWKTVTCRIQNNTNFALDSQLIVAILFDSNGEFLTCCYTYESIKPNEKKGYELGDLTMDQTINITGATAKIYVYDSYIR